MFNNIGGKIKGVASVICWVGIICSVIIGGSMLLNKYSALVGVVVIIVGALLSWVSSFLLYGIGELIAAVMSIDYKMDRFSYVAHTAGASNTWKCVHCGQENTNNTAQCKGCGKYRA